MTTEQSAKTSAPLGWDKTLVNIDCRSTACHLHVPGLQAALTRLRDAEPASAGHQRSLGRSTAASDGWSLDGSAVDDLVAMLSGWRRQFVDNGARVVATDAFAQRADRGLNARGHRPALAIPVHFEVGMRDVVMRDSGAVSRDEWQALAAALDGSDEPAADVLQPLRLVAANVDVSIAAVGPTSAESRFGLLALGDRSLQPLFWHWPDGDARVRSFPDPIALANGVTLGWRERGADGARAWLRWITVTQLAWRDHPVNRARQTRGLAPVEAWFFWAPPEGALPLAASSACAASTLSAENIDVVSSTNETESRRGDWIVPDDLMPATWSWFAWQRLVLSKSHFEYEDPDWDQIAVVVAHVSASSAEAAVTESLLSNRGRTLRETGATHQVAPVQAFDDYFLRAEHRDDPLAALLGWPARFCKWKRALDRQGTLIDASWDWGLVRDASGAHSMGRTSHESDWWCWAWDDTLRGRWRAAVRRMPLICHRNPLRRLLGILETIQR
ncbi:MAG: hypothetical protein ACK4IT_01120 [Thioalkalivibrionaceae bacterium]